MKGSLGGRVFRTSVVIGVVNVAITLVATELIYEDIEETNLDIALAQERRFFEQQIQEARPYQWQSALLTALYVPPGEPIGKVPEMFQGRPIPFAAEVNVGPATYLISIARTDNPPGVLYLAQDTTVVENREDLLQEIGIFVFAACMLLLSFTLARIGTGRIIRPLQNLSRQIRNIQPGTPISRIRTEYADRELAEIADVLNDLLEALDAYVRREKALVSLASHELRTPLAVISGALDVLEQRASLGDANHRTIDRIRQAADKMQADVDTLLKLAHRSEKQDPSTPVDLPTATRAVITELENGAPGSAGRVSWHQEGDTAKVLADPALVHMLLRNLIQNAVRHTRGPVHIVITKDWLSISDAGEGLPSHVQSRLGTRAADSAVPDDGLGLFIVRLICDRLGWQLQVRTSGEGTIIDLLFGVVTPA